MRTQCRRLATTLLAAALATYNPPGHAQSSPALSPSLAAQVDAIVAEPTVSRAHWGVAVTRLDGTPVYARNDGQLFQPASNNKLFTTATAMALLPTGHRFTTTVSTTGKANGDTLHGDLVLTGVGDPNLSGRALPYVSPALRPPTTAEPDPLRYIAELAGQLADQFKQQGITTIEGDIVGDDTLFPWEPYPSDWAIDDTLWYYGAPINALMVNDNAIRLTIAPGANFNDPAIVTLNPALPYYTIENNITTIRKGVEGHTDIERSTLVSNGSRTLRLYGTIAVDAPPQTEDIAIEDPAEYATLALESALQDRGITIKGMAKAQHRYAPSYTFTRTVTAPIPDLKPAPEARLTVLLKTPTARVLAKHVSDPLLEDIIVLNKTSQNQHAELLLRQLGYAITGDGSTAQGARVVRAFLTTQAGIDPEDFIFYDGSGLSGHDLVTPRATAKLLHYATTQPWFADWKRSLPIGGEDGGLRTRFANPPLKDHLFAKTGTLSEVRALSGYIDCKSGQTLIFSIMVNAHTPRTADDAAAIDRIVAAIAATN